MIEPSNQVRNLGMVFDQQLNVGSHAGRVHKAGFFYLRRLKCLKCLNHSREMKLLRQLGSRRGNSVLAYLWLMIIDETQMRQ